jgi:hypothetical protein
MTEKIFNETVSQSLIDAGAWTLDNVKESRIALLSIGLALPVGAYALKGLWSSLFSPLAKYPGPLLASEYLRIASCNTS